ncbi:MAG: histidine kinase [Bacteroidia bacterium]|nr:histidine kinase [Bacteroidia bacterium]MBT8308852.1 histidine kinase [Bacteroidia bacterium]NND09955.1 histidine kinase [Flavobacteriaceae bacterium]NNK27506.1 histidine kinase [Flavobacteriaceae bacterium]RZV66928.1 MAG: histidine kinase [Flavobacteriaceae bacterium]
MLYIWLDLFLQESKPISSASERLLLVYMIAVLLIVSALVILFFVVFQKRKNKLLLDKFKREQEFQEEIAKAQLEIQDQTLKNVAWELHDNVGQLLSVANMQLNVISKKIPEDSSEGLHEIKDVVNKSLKEVRSLSKSLNSDVIQNIGLVKSIQNELDRFNKLKFFGAKLQLTGEAKHIDAKDEIIIFRIIQEFFSNSMKYSQANNLSVNMNYFDDRLEVNVSDDGVGFEMGTIEKGSGLINMKSRARLINADFSLDSRKNEGVSLFLRYYY